MDPEETDVVRAFCGERGIRTITGVDITVTCTLHVAILPVLATFAKAPWLMLAHEPESYGRLHGES
jgi:hypothetical protein